MASTPLALWYVFHVLWIHFSESECFGGTLNGHSRSSRVESTRGDDGDAVVADEFYLSLVGQFEGDQHEERQPPQNPSRSGTPRRTRASALLACGGEEEAAYVPRVGKAHRSCAGGCELDVPFSRVSGDACSVGPERPPGDGQRYPSLSGALQHQPRPAANTSSPLGHGRSAGGSLAGEASRRNPLPLSRVSRSPHAADNP
jgi:hypothetical protein